MHLIPILIFVLWMKPGLILTPKLVHQLFDKYGAQYFSKTPSKLDLKIRSPGLLTKHVMVEAADFCLKEPEACFSIAHAEIKFKVAGLPKIEIRELGPVEIRNTSFKYVSEEKTTAKPKPSPSEPKQLVTFSDDFKVHPILIDFPDVKVVGEDETILGRLRLEKGQSEELTLEADASSNREMKLQARARTEFALNLANPVKLDVTLKRAPNQLIDGHLNGKINWQTLRGEITGGAEMKHLVPWVNSLAIRNLRASRQEKLHLRTEIDARLEPELPTKQKSVLPPAPLAQKMKGSFEADEKDGFVQYALKIDPVQNQGIIIEGGAIGRYPFDPKEKSFYGIERLGLEIGVPDFQRLVRQFKPTSFAIPAPFSAMHGSIKLEVGDVDKNLVGASLPLKFNTDLNSPEQAILTQSNGQLEFTPETGALSVNGNTHIKLLKVTMPDLKILEPIPLVNYDNRIVSKEQREEKETKTEDESGTEFNWKMTSDPGGIQIYHPILKPYAPIDVDWEVGNNPRGQISLRPFVIDYLNRPAKVARMRFYQDPKTLEFSYDGRLVVKKTDYTIFIDIFKVGEKTKIELTSSPPLNEDDIVSVLLFNDVTSALDQDQSSSVGSTRSAIANRALGLFSILALSSTPIEAVNYNAATGVYSARVRLASGLTATVGTNWDQTQEVALRKRLGRNFVLSTVLQSPSGDSEDTQKTMLEWFRRF